MELREISFNRFDEFASNHKYRSFYQSSKYALIAAENGYDYDYIGMFDDSNSLLAASLILIKKIKRSLYYGYAPKGFLVDYDDDSLLTVFSNLIKDYYRKKNVVFIKVNPDIVVGKLKNKTFEKINHSNINYSFEKNSYLKLKNNLYFESSLPRFNAIIDLDKYDFNKFNKNTKNKVRKSLRKGLFVEFGDLHFIDTLENINKKKKSNIDLHSFYNTFGKDGNIDMFLVKIDYEKFLINAREEYDKELANNTRLNELIAKYPTEENVSQKMNSDLILLAHKNDILEGTKGLKEEKEDYIAGAVTLKYGDTVTIIFSDFDRTYSRQNANYFLYYYIVNYYKGNYKYIDLNGMTGDMTHNNPYYGLNEFKLGFNPDVYEYIGEHDLIIDSDAYCYLKESGILAKEFNKKK